MNSKQKGRLSGAAKWIKNKYRLQHGIEHGLGWVGIVAMCLYKMEKLGWDGDLKQVKEKFGGLRIYIGKSNKELRGAIREAELQARVTCQMCGTFKPSNGFLCDDCDKANAVESID